MTDPTRQAQEAKTEGTNTALSAEATGHSPVFENAPSWWTIHQWTIMFVFPGGIALA